MRKKQLLSITMAALLVAGLCACGDKGASEAPAVQETQDGTEVSQEEAGEAGAETAEKDQETITLKFFNNEPTLTEKLNEINAEYTRRNPHVQIEVIDVPGSDYYTKVDTTILSGEQLDICFFNVKFDYTSRAAQGEFYPMDEFIQAEGASSVTDLYTIDSSMEDGKVYGLPGDVKEYLVWINKEDLDKAGLEVPPLDWTWDDFEEYAQKLTWGEGPDKHYGAMLYTWDHYNVLTAYNRLDDNPYLNEDGTLNLDDPAFRESLELRYRLEQETQCAIPLSEVMATNLDFRTAFFSGKCSMLLMATNIIPQTADLENYPHTFQTTYASFPMPEGGRPGYAYADNRFYSIGATTVNAEEAYKYIRYFTTEGIPMKGVTFTADTNNTTGITDVVELMTATNPKLYDKEQLLKVLTNPNLKNNFWEYVPSYTGEIVNLYRAQAEKAVMGEISFDEALSVATEQCQQVIDNNQ